MKNQPTLPTARGHSGARWWTQAVRSLSFIAGLALAASPTLAGSLIFNNGFEGGAADWDATGPWQKGTWTNVAESTIAREGVKSARFRSSMPNDNRSEFTIMTGEGRYDWFNSTTGIDNEYWVGMSIYIISPPANGIPIMQHHSTPATVGGAVDWAHSSGENSITIAVASPTQLVVQTATNSAKVDGEPHAPYIHTQTGSAAWGTVNSPLYTFQTGHWYDFVMHYKLSPENSGANAGLMEVWVTNDAGVRTQLVNKTGTSVYRYDSGYNNSITPKTWDRDGLPKTPRNNQKIGIYHLSSTAGDVLYDSVRIWKGSGGSIAAVSPAGGGTVPSAPTGLTAGTPTSSSVPLSWTDTSNNETGFEVDRALNSTFSSGLVTNAYTAGTNATALPAPGATGLSPSTTYYFRARATNGIGDSTNSNTASATTSGGTPVVYDANALTISASSGETSAAVTFTGASNGNFLRYDSNAVNDFVSFTVNVATAGSYTVSVKYHENGFRGIVQLQIDGTNQGSAFDAYSATAQLTTVSLGTKTLTAGNHTFRFQITGKNASSADYQIGLDTITLTP